MNADSGTAIAVRTDNETRAFIRGTLDNGTAPGAEGGDGQSDAGQPEDDTGEDILYYVVVTDAEGNVVERIPVRSGQDTAIVAPDDDRVTVVNGTANTTNTTASAAVAAPG